MLQKPANGGEKAFQKALAANIKVMENAGKKPAVAKAIALNWTNQNKPARRPRNKNV
jgi:hypothetical protein